MAWTHVSPSQIESFLKCKRSWFFKSVLRVQELQKGHQALGESFHLVLEKVPKGLPWPQPDETGANTEEWDKASQLAKIALPLLPQDPQGKILREHGIKISTYLNGPTMVGYIDLAIPVGIGWPALLIPVEESIVGDYKTLSDFRYMKTPEELANGVQMMTYAKWAVSPGGLGSDTVRLVHLYARTRGAIGRNSIRNETAIVTTPQINAFWDKTLDVVREMEQVSSCGKYEDVEANGALTGHCEAFGGCYFRDKCGIGGPSNIKSLFQIGKKPAPTGSNVTTGSSILAKIQAARANAGQAPTSTPVAATSPTPQANLSGQLAQSVDKSGETPVSSTIAPELAPVAKPTGPISSMMAKIASTGHGLPNLNGAAAQALNKETGKTQDTYPGEGMRAQNTINTVGELLKCASGIVPPDAPPRTQAVITTPGQAVVDPEADPVVEGDEEDAETTGSVTGVSSSAASTVASTVPTSVPGNTVAVLDSSPIPEKPRRGRPTKEEMASREKAEQDAFNARVGTEVQKRLAALGSTGADSSEIIRLNGELSKAKEIISKHNIEAIGQNTSWLSEKSDLEDTIRQLRAKLDEVPTVYGINPAPTGCTLYIDCHPTKGSPEVVDFFSWIAPITAAVAQDNEVKDWRLIQYTSKGLLAHAIREAVKAEGLPAAIAIPSYAGGADVALEILTPLAKSVIRKL